MSDAFQRTFDVHAMDGDEWVIRGRILSAETSLAIVRELMSSGYERDAIQVECHESWLYGGDGSDVTLPGEDDPKAPEKPKANAKRKRQPAMPLFGDD